MYVRVTRGRYNGDNFDEVQRLIEDSFVPALQQLPGFQGYRGGFNRTAGTLVAISFWDTEEQSRAIQGRRGPFEALGVEFETAEVYEVTVQV